MPRCRFLFGCDLGDPVSCIHLSNVGCMAGTMMGKVWLCSFESGRVETLTAYSDEGIRGLYMDEENGFATFNEGCKSWKQASPQSQSGGAICFRSLDRKNTQTVKHVLQRGQLACVLFPMSSCIVNVKRGDHQTRAFRFMDCGSGSSFEVAPCDFDGESLVLVDRTQSCSSPTFRFIQLERNEALEIDDLPRSGSASLLKLWREGFLVYVVGRTAYIYNYREKELSRSLKGHGAEIIAIDAQDDQVIGTLSSDATVKLWTGETGECLRTIIVQEASFFLGYPYCLNVLGRRVLVSADEGVYLLEFDAEPGEP